METMIETEGTEGLTKEKINKLADKFYNKVIEKMDAADFETEMVHEDIRTMHHLVKLQQEISSSVPIRTNQ